MNLPEESFIIADGAGVPPCMSSPSALSADQIWQETNLRREAITRNWLHTFLPTVPIYNDLKTMPSFKDFAFGDILFSAWDILEDRPEVKAKITGEFERLTRVHKYKNPVMILHDYDHSLIVIGAAERTKAWGDDGA